MCSGDNVFADETRPLLPHTAFVVTKQALGQRSALHLSPEASCAAIEAGAKQAMQLHLRQPVEAVHVAGPIHCKVRAQSVALADLFAITPLVERVSGTELEFTGADMHYVVRVLNTLSAMGMGLS